MGHTRISRSIWLFLSIVYLGFTAYVIYYASTCTEMFCQLVIILPGLPWSLFGIEILDHFGASESTVFPATVLFAVLNVALLYLIIGGLLRLFRRKPRPESSADPGPSGRIFT